MLLALQRGRIKTVTEFPVLVPATPKEQEGAASFLAEFGPVQPVRRLRTADLKGASRAMGEHEAKHFSAVMVLRKALGSRPDTLALKKAGELLRESYELKRKRQEHLFPETSKGWENSDFARALTAFVGTASSEEAMEIYQGFRPGPRASQDPRWLLSYEVSQALREARFVLWWDGERFRPAVWCPNLKTAFYARALLDLVGTKSIRVCAFCGDFFGQKRTDQDYCSISHREAHRVARWRARKKLTQQRKGVRHGTRKAR